MSGLAQHKIEQSDHIEAFFEYATMSVVITDKSGIITAVNPYCIKEFGYTLKELSGKRIEILIPSRFQEKHSQYHKQYITKPVTRKMGAGKNLFAVKKDGTEFPVEIRLNNYKLDGEIYVIAFVHNISLQKKAEAKIKKLNTDLETLVIRRTRDLNEALKQLKTTNARMEEVYSYQKAILDHAGAMIIATDEKGIIKLYNPEAALNIGYEESEVIDKMTPMSFHIKSEIDRKRQEILKEYGISIKEDFEVMIEKAKRSIREEQEYCYIRKNGTIFPVSLTITALHDKKNKIIGYMGISFDISERKKLQESLLKSLEKEKELGELKSRFVSMASHEFRTPLSTVLSSAYLIEKYRSSKDQLKRETHLQRIYSSVNMLTDILNDFLSLGKIEEGKIPVRLTRFNIREQVIAIKEEIKNTLKKKQKIRYLHKGGEEVLLDPSLLKHIIMNLVSNASKFSYEGSTIEIKTISHDHYFALSVKDHGIGISCEDQKHLMQRFFRGANAGNIQGTGLGLHIVSKYAELLKGKVQCISELGKGTELKIIFDTINGLL